MEIVQVGDHYEVWDYTRKCMYVGSFSDCEQFIDENSTTSIDEYFEWNDEP